ncbi:MAG: CDP-alcohol phosphatidyltransferase family protein [Bacilli bacterium]|nr:CDP-alcohol phosphatidyltransferase family protein [Bacilli bacterium]MDD4809172.1 CDP-alcohol phosphatidyltransferase family protein [Bacilli bacterium]
MDKETKQLTNKEMWAKVKADFKNSFNDLKHKETRKKQIPNLLTGSRMFAPLFIAPAALSGNFLLAGILTAGFAATDAFDGYFARKYDAISEFGKDLDPFCDKIFAAGLIVPLVFIYPNLLFNLGLEAVISKINYTSKIKGNVPRTNMFGKVKTASLSLLLVSGYLANSMHIPSFIIPSLTVVTTVLQLLTAKSYYQKYLADEEKKKEIIKKDEINKPEEKKTLEKTKAMNNKSNNHHEIEQLKEMKQEIENLNNQSINQDDKKKVLNKHLNK